MPSENPVIGPKPQKMIHIRLPDECHRSVRVYVAKKGMTIQDWVKGLIDEALRKVAK